jgi:hypothetical protein
VMLGVIMTACASTRTSQNRVICPSADRFSCYYSSSGAPVRGPRTIDNHRVVGRLPSYCTQKTDRCVAGSAVSLFYDTKIVKGPHPTGEYLEWNIRNGGRDTRLAVYVPLSEVQTHEFGQLPKG